MPEIKADKTRIRQLWQNLIENSIKYSGNTENLKIEIGHKILNDEIIFFIKDNGIGIEMPYYEKIFNLFDKLDNSSDGTGIGLALAKRIVEIHNGKIWVESDGKNKGATFYFTIKK